MKGELASSTNVDKIWHFMTTESKAFQIYYHMDSLINDYEEPALLRIEPELHLGNKSVKLKKQLEIEFG